MFAQERREQIIKQLRIKKRMEVRQLEEIFQVSGATLRTDLRELEKEGKLLRTHGGAMLLENDLQKEDILSGRKNIEQKKFIAQTAIDYIKEYDSLLLDSGSTTLEFARELKNFKNLKVITNDLQIALELQENSWIELYLIGGKVRNRFRLTNGVISLDFIKNIAVDKVFLAPNALSAMDGATTSNEEMRAMKQAMMASSTESYMLCDSSKIGKRAFCKFADPSEFQMMFTDSGISQKEKEALEKKGMQITICE